MKINKFVPPQFERHPLDIDLLNKLTKKKWQYATSGRAAFYHILKAINVDKILIPVYICPTVLVPLKKLQIKPIFYDIDIDDLNPSLESIKFFSEQYDVKTVLVASMYGNPANLVDIEAYCKDKGIFLIDDAAQSFGAKLDNRYIGTFGDAGFFSFSPGKPTAGHMGSFFWSSKKNEIKRVSHCFIHYLRWLDFYMNRYDIHRNYGWLCKKSINFISRILIKFVNIDYDEICKFENNILGGILYSMLNNKFDFRNKYSNDFYRRFRKFKRAKVLKGKFGKANNHKIILIFDCRAIATNFFEYMLSNDIFVNRGYNLLTNDLFDLHNAKTIDGCIIEIPIEKEIEKMEYIYEVVRKFDL